MFYTQFQLNPTKTSREVISDLANLCDALDITQAELDRALSMPASERYTEKATPKKDGSTRKVYNPHYLIRKIQRRINHRIFADQATISWPDHIFGSIPNQFGEDGKKPKDYIACAQCHCGAKSILTIDIKDFFDNIHISLVSDVFSEFLKYPPDVANALANICCMDSHVVQGALTSSYIAGLCLFDVEGVVVNQLHRKHLAYTRLVDDINVSSGILGYNFDYVKKLIEDMLTGKGLPINSQKTNIQHISTKPLIVHGLRISFKEPRLPADEVKRIRAAVKNIEILAAEKNYRTSRSYRHDFNRCMGRVNKLERVGHNQHGRLLSRLKKILPLPSKKDIETATKQIERLEKDQLEKGGSYWYKKRFYLVHERLTILQRSFPIVAKKLRARLKLIKAVYQ